MQIKNFRITPEKHSCGETLVEKVVPVNEKIISWEGGYPVNYCPKCEIYKQGKNESKNSEVIGDIITNTQAKTNLKNHNSIYTVDYLEKIAKATTL